MTKLYKIALLFAVLLTGTQAFAMCPAQITAADITNSNFLNTADFGGTSVASRNTTINIGRNTYNIDSVQFNKKDVTKPGTPVNNTLGASIVGNHLSQIDCKFSHNICECRREWYDQGVLEVMTSIKLKQ
jgi:hypothetical protein